MSGHGVTGPQTTDNIVVTAWFVDGVYSYLSFFVADWNDSMRGLIVLAAFFLCVSPTLADGLDPQQKSPYQLRIVVRTADHPTLTKHFRAEVLKNVSSALQAALGAVGTVEAIDLNSTPDAERDSLMKLVNEKGLEALDNVMAAV